MMLLCGCERMETRKNSSGFLKLSKDSLSKYLASLYGGDVKILDVRRLKGGDVPEDLKGFGYGVPYVVEFAVNGEGKQAVLETMRPEGFGHDHFADRAGILFWQHSTFNKLPKHVQSIDVGAFTAGGESLKSLGDCAELFLVTEFVDGDLYHTDLDRIKETGKLGRLDEQRCLALSDYLAEVHSVKREAPWLYARRIRELVGHGECIMGLLDSYPLELDFVNETELIELERDCVIWRWRLKRKAHRLSQVHGDFHPWNVLFREGVDFTVLDRSRGEWGEPADDAAAMTVNYLFYSLQKHGKLSGVFERLFKLFWKNYLQKTLDQVILETVQPFYAWRALVVASPLWYPHLEKSVRVKLLNFARNVLQTGKFDLENVNAYLEKPVTLKDK
jgi:tRNA A-37 threonylcarbamoyl transferase component Bud32